MNLHGRILAYIHIIVSAESHKNISFEQQVIYRHKFQKNHKWQVSLGGASSNDIVLARLNMLTCVAAFHGGL